MRRSVLIVMLDVMVLSVLTLTRGGGDAARFVVPMYRWSSLIERGLEREEAFEQRVAELEQQAEQQAFALAEAQRLQAELTAAAQAAREREAAAATRADDEAQVRRAAEERALAAREEALSAQAAAEAARERQQRAEEAARTALAAKESATARATQAEAEVVRARTETRLLEQRETEARQRIESLRREASAGAERSAELAAVVREAEQRLAEAARAAEEARQRETDAAQTAAAALERERETLEQMRRIEQEFHRAQGRLEQVDETLQRAREAEQQTQIELATVRRDAETAVQTLEEIARERRQSVWVMREQAMRRFDVDVVVETRDTQPLRTSATLHLPMVELEQGLYAISEFSTLRLDWRGIQRFSSLSEFSVAMHRPGGDPPLARAPLLFSRQNEPRIVYIPLPRGSGEQGLRPIGLTRLKEERVRSGLLFKAGEPDRSLRVEFTPSLDAEGYLLVRSAEPGSRIDLREGDYILTENGFLVGIMVTRSLCYVIPADLPSPGQRRLLPLRKADGDPHLSELVKQARAAREQIRDLPDHLVEPSRWFWPF